MQAGDKFKLKSLLLCPSSFLKARPVKVMDTAGDGQEALQFRVSFRDHLPVSSWFLQLRIGGFGYQAEPQSTRQPPLAFTNGFLHRRGVLLGGLDLNFDFSFLFMPEF